MTHSKRMSLISRSVVLWNCLPPDVSESVRPKQGSNGDAFSSSLG